MLKDGEKAPDFTLENSEGNPISLGDFPGKTIVVYFYPKDDTPGCTMEGIEFTELSSEFEALGAKVIGVSKDTCVSHAAFRDKYGLNICLVADVEGVLCNAYGCDARLASKLVLMTTVLSVFTVPVLFQILA